MGEGKAGPICLLPPGGGRFARRLEAEAPGTPGTRAMEVSWKNRLSLHTGETGGSMISLDRLHSQRLIGAMTLIWVREHHLQLNWSLYLNREHGIDDLATERVAVFSSARWPDYMQFACLPDWQGAALEDRMVTFLIAKYAKKCIGKQLLSPARIELDFRVCFLHEKLPKQMQTESNLAVIRGLLCHRLVPPRFLCACGDCLGQWFMEGWQCPVDYYRHHLRVLDKKLSEEVRDLIFQFLTGRPGHADAPCHERIKIGHAEGKLPDLMTHLRALAEPCPPRLTHPCSLVRAWDKNPLSAHLWRRLPRGCTWNHMHCEAVLDRSSPPWGFLPESDDEDEYCIEGWLSPGGRYRHRSA